MAHIKFEDKWARMPKTTGAALNELISLCLICCLTSFSKLIFLSTLAHLSCLNKKIWPSLSYP